MVKAISVMVQMYGYFVFMKSTCRLKQITNKTSNVENIRVDMCPGVLCCVKYGYSDKSCCHASKFRTPFITA